MQSISQLRGIWGSAAALGIFPAVSLLVGRIGGSTVALMAAALASQRASAVAEDAVAPWGLANLLEAGHVCYSPLATEAAVIVREMAPAPKERRQEDRSFGFGKAADRCVATAKVRRRSNSCFVDVEVPLRPYPGPPRLAAVPLGGPFYDG